MSYYAGFSLREVYKKRCADLQCAANSALVKLLSDVPDDFTSLSSLDLSRNFLGTKGVIPLLDVVECATAIRSLDLRNQELGNEAVAIICARLRRHPSLQKLNMSDNPITLAVGTDLLELAKNNHVLQYIFLERTFVRPSIVTVIEVQLEKNRQCATGARQVSPTRPVITATATSSTPAAASPPPPATTSTPGTTAVEAAPTDTTRAYTPTATDASSLAATKTTGAATPAGTGAAAAAALLLRSGLPHAKPVERRRCPPHEIQHVLSPFTHAVTDVLFDADPTSALWSWCEDRHYFFDDVQFSSRNNDLHRTSRHTYGIAGWRRVGELYPQATLFGIGAVTNFCTVSDEHKESSDNHATAVSAAAASGLLPEANSLFVQLPTNIPEGFTWTFTSVVASVKDMNSLGALLCCPRSGAAGGAARPSVASSPPLALQKGTEFPGIYTMRFYTEGGWRYLVVDDFLPVDKFGRLIFTKPSLNDTAFWPCILEKMLAKLYGGYHALDSHFDEHHVGIDRPSIRRPIAWDYLSRENLRRVTDGSPGEGSPFSDDLPSASLHLERIPGSCGRIMAHLTSGFYESHCLHPLEGNVKGRWWDVMVKALAAPRQSYGSAASRNASVLPPGTTAHAVGEGRAHQMSSERQPLLGGVGRVSTAANVAVASPAVHTGVVAFSRDGAHTRNGIHARTAYQVLRACQVNGVRLLMLRNPWCGAQKWSGDWADDSPLWKKNPEVSNMLLQRASTFAGRNESLRGLSEASAYAHGDSSVLTMQSNLKRSLLTAMRSSSGGGNCSTTVPSMSQSIISSRGDGSGGGVAHVAKSTFWMSYTDFLQNFDWVHLCRVFGEEFYRQDIHHEWTCETAGGHIHELSWHTNPHYRLMLPHRTTVQLQLNRRDVGLHHSRAAAAVDAVQRGEGGIGLQVIRDAYYPLHCPSPNLHDAKSPFMANSSSGAGSGSGSGNGGAAAAAIAVGTSGDAPADGKLLAASPLSSPSFSALLFSAVEQVGDHLTADITLDAGTEYWVVPTTHAPRTLDHFDLSVVAPASFQMQEAAESQYWDSRTTSQELLVASSMAQVSQDDGELAILFKAYTRVLVDEVAVLMQAERKRHTTQREGSRASVAAATPSDSLPPCRVVVTATMEVADNNDDTGEFGVDEAYEPQMRQDESFTQGPAALLALVRGEVDSEGNPSRTIGDITPHPACVYSIGQNTVLETEVAPAADHGVAYYTAICSPRPAGIRALLSYQVWCAAPLLEVRSLPKWAKEEITVGWDEQHGSGSFYDCDGHPQIELTELQPYQRFTVTLRMVDYNTISPAIMFSVIRNAHQTGEPISGRIADNELYARSDYVDVPEVQAIFELNDDVPASLLLIPCLQPTGSCGRCVVTISSDSAHFRARALCGGTRQ
jgi:hypothetical protein